jgi:hypothetical protein
VLASDLIITIIMTYGLYRVKTGWAHTDSRLRRIMMCVSSSFSLWTEHG